MRSRTYILLLFLAIAFSLASSAQKCPSGKKDKKAGIETFTHIFTSKEYYSLLVQKKVNFLDTAASPTYWLLLTAASRVHFTDSMLATKGTIELHLANGTTLVVNEVTYMNAPLGNSSLGFSANLSVETIRQLAASPIETLSVKNVLSTSFATKKQNEQPDIFACLLRNRPQ
ncbi:MAG TPA: hypothetical protein VGB71_04815 [Flavisolibacter sp.]